MKLEYLFKIIPLLGTVIFIYLLLNKSGNYILWGTSIFLIYSTIIYNLIYIQKGSKVINAMIVLAGILGVCGFIYFIY